MKQTPITFAYGNIVTPLVSAVASSSNPLAPVGYTLSDFRGKSCESGDTDDYIQLHFTSAQTFNCFAVIDTNLTAAGTVELRASTDAFVASDVQIVGNLQIAGPVTLALFELKTVYTDLRIRMVDAANPDGFIRFGKLFVGTAVTTNRNYAPGWAHPRIDRSVRVNDLNGSPSFNRKPKPRMPSLPFVKVRPEDEKLVDALVDEVGITDPFIAALDIDNRPERTYLVRFASLPVPVQPIVAERYSYSLALEEVVG